LVEITEAFLALNQTHHHHQHAVIGAIDGRRGWFRKIRHDPLQGVAAEYLV
jgi:hypothetical protein